MDLPRYRQLAAASVKIVGTVGSWDRGKGGGWGEAEGESIRCHHVNKVHTRLAQVYIYLFYSPDVDSLYTLFFVLSRQKLTHQFSLCICTYVKTGTMS